MRTLLRVKREVEQELEIRSARIEGAVARLKSDVSIPGSALRRLARKHPYESLFGLVAIGAAAAFLVVNRPRDGSTKSTGKAPSLADAYADVIGAGIHEAEKSGLDRMEALRAAIRANPPVVFSPDPSKSPTYLKQVSDRFVNTLTAIAFEYATTWLSQLVSRRNGTS